MNSAPIKYNDGPIRAGVIAMFDITKLKNTEKALQEAKDQAADVPGPDGR